MIRQRLSRLFGDARHIQLSILGLLLAVNLVEVDFGADPASAAVAVGAGIATQILCSRLVGLPRAELRSAVIAALSLSLLLRGDALWVHALAAVIAIGAKFLVRVRGKHIFNPSALGIAVLIFATDHAWVSPGQWGTNLWFALLLSLLGFCVLHASRRTDIVLFYLFCHCGLLLARALWLGDPLAITLNQLQNGSLLLFAFFMISDPRTIPDARRGRFLFAALVALVAHWLAFHWHFRPALYAALVGLSPLIPLLDRLFPADRFEWTTPAGRRDLQPC
ncbi:MAG: RnfABCDGE type electron transport complex subunit D [Magnetospirillum sp.]|nr:RnfABCDGE type electron transport complex subunit D [Magnetospirillum sp.]